MDDTVTENTIETGIEGKKVSPFSLLIGVMIRPKKTFDDIREAAHAYWWVVFLLTIIVSSVLVVISAPIEAEANRAQFETFEDDPRFADLDEEEFQQAQSFPFETIQLVTGLVFAVIGAVLGYAVRAGILFLISLVLGGTMAFKQAWRLAVWVSIPLIIRATVSTIAVIATGNLPALGLSFALSAEELISLPILAAIFGFIDIYRLWVWVLIGVGMTATAKVSRSKGITTALIYAILGIVGVIVMAAVGVATTNAFGG